MTRRRARFSSALVQHGCKRRPYGLSARALSSLEVYIRNSKDDKQVCNRRLSSAAIMTPFCLRWSRFGSQAPPLFSRALKRLRRLGTRLVFMYIYDGHNLVTIFVLSYLWQPLLYDCKAERRNIEYLHKRLGCSRRKKVPFFSW